MKRYPLLIQLIVYVFVFILLLLGLVGSLYYQTSSATIGQLTERTTRNSIDQSSQFITSYLKKLKQTTSVLSKEETVRQFAQDKEVSPEAVQSLMQTIIETDPDLVSAVLVTKDGRLVATDSQISMQTSSDMMNERWYQEAIKERAMPVLTPARKESLSSEKDQVGDFYHPGSSGCFWSKSRSFAPRYWLSKSRGLSGSSPTREKRL